MKWHSKINSHSLQNYSSYLSLSSLVKSWSLAWCSSFLQHSRTNHVDISEKILTGKTYLSLPPSLPICIYMCINYSVISKVLTYFTPDTNIYYILIHIQMYSLIKNLRIFPATCYDST